MDKKKKKYIVLTIIAVLLIGLLILINVIGAGTKSASAESVIEYPTPQTTVRTTATEEYTDITQFAPSSEYKNYLVTKTFEDTYQIYWFEEGYVSQGFLNSYDEVLNSTFNTVYNKVGKVGNDETALSNWESTYIDAQKIEVISFSNFGYEGTAIKTEIKKSVSVSKTLVSDKFSSLDLLINAIINRSADLKTIDEIRSQLVIYPNDTLKLFGQEIYSNYNELNLIQIVQSSTFGNAFFSDIPQDLGPEIVNRANEQQKIKDDAYTSGENEGYQNGINATRNEIFSSASLVSAKMEDGTNLNAPLNITAKGIAFTSIALVADDYAIKNNLDGADKHFTIIFNIIPFAFSKNQIYLSMSYGFYSLVFIDENNTRYNMEWDSNNKTKDGYAIYPYNNEAIYQNKIKQIQIEFADIDHTGSLIIPSSSNTENAYNTGYNEGKSDGYKDGYAEGLATGNGPMPTISKLFSTVNSALQVNLIGDISLQDLLNIMLCVTFVIIALKLFAGG